MSELNWIATRDGAAAPGAVFTYRVHVTGWGRIKLARIDRAVSAADDVSAIIEQVMRTSFDLGTYPRGRLRAGIEQAKAWAQQFEDGRPLVGQPEWQDPPPKRPQLREHLAEGDGSALRILGTTGGHFGPTRYPTPEQAAELLRTAKDRFPYLGPDRVLVGGTYAEEGLAEGTDATPEHLAMTGPQLREHLDARPGHPLRGHGVPRLAEQAVAGHHGDGDPLRDLHVRRHSYNRPEATS